MTQKMTTQLKMDQHKSQIMLLVLSVIRTRMPRVIPDIVLLLSHLEFELMNRLDKLTERLKHPPQTYDLYI